nr:unnamed protein product [Callosobruchus analis]
MDHNLSTQAEQNLLFASRQLYREIGYFYKPVETDYICSKSSYSGMHSCSNLPPFKNGSQSCNLTVEEKELPQYRNNDSYCVNWHFYYSLCSDRNQNPFQDTISFDNIGLAWIAIFLFSETKKREMERMRLERARFQSSSTLASSTNNSEPTSCYAEIVKYIAHLWRRSKRRLLKKIRLYRVRRDQRREKKIAIGETIRLNYARRHHPNCPRLRQNQQSQSAPSTRNVSRTSSVSENVQKNEDVELVVIPKRPSLLRVPSASNTDIPSLNNNDSPTNLLSPSTVPNNRRRSSVMFSDIIMLHGQNVSPPSSSSNLLAATTNIDRKNVCSSEKTTQAGDGNIWQITSVPNQQQAQQQIQQDCNELVNGETLTCQELLALGAINAALPTGQIVLDTFFNSLSKGFCKKSDKTGEDLYMQQLPEDNFSCCQDLWHCESEYKNEKRSRCYIICCLIIKGTVRFLKTMRRYIKVLVEHKFFRNGILLAILINTLSMGIEHHKQSEILTHAVEVTNVIFSIIFAVEMLLKIIAEGPFGYISNGFNVFDGIIVVLRLLRILKLVRFMPNLRRQLFVMLRTMDNVAVFFSLLILFIFIFSYSEEGLCLSNKPEDKDRKNFDSLLWSLVTVFQILTQEDWNMVLSNGMAKTSNWAALYFVALMTFGNYVLFNLLVAILVEGFSSERNERREREQRELARRKMSCILEASLKEGSRDSSSPSVSSSDSFSQGKKNCWKSAEELRKLKDFNNDRIGILNATAAILPKNPSTSPPIITHTAATPQDSPSTTLDEYPEFSYNVTTVAISDLTFSEPESPAIPSSEDSLTQRTSASLSLLKPPSLSPPPLTYREFEKPPELKLVTHNERIGSKTMTFSEKVGHINKNENNPNQEKDKIQRKCSWKLASKPSLKKKKPKASSDSDAPLNNGRDHSHCNGGGVARQASLRDDSLLQSSIRIQNDTQKEAPNNKSAKGLTPQNSIRCRSDSHTTTKSQVNIF